MGHCRRMLRLLILTAAFAFVADAKQPRPAQTGRSRVHQPVAYPTKHFETRPELGKYQDAWRFIRLNKKMHLYKRSYKGKGMYHDDEKCVVAKPLSIGSDKVTMKVTNNGKTMFHWFLRKNHTTEYEDSNVLVASFSERSPGYQYPMVFSDYKSCGILRVPHHERENRLACELWAIGKKPKVGNCCRFVYDLLCGKKDYVEYDAQKCKQ
ncbi:male-specific histamine-binding salivary protein-like [Ornithodoros turicata]|uniref:male-specific histamine-binding salivary protein-like n=1 Tax=Ornithodoros turicata TaxID=34597 RepID=UPI00313990E7